VISNRKKTLRPALWLLLGTIMLGLASAYQWDWNVGTGRMDMNGVEPDGHFASIVRNSQGRVFSVGDLYIRHSSDTMDDQFLTQVDRGWQNLVHRRLALEAKQLAAAAAYSEGLGAVYIGGTHNSDGTNKDGFCVSKYRNYNGTWSLCTLDNVNHPQSWASNLAIWDNSSVTRLCVTGRQYHEWHYDDFAVGYFKDNGLGVSFVDTAAWDFDGHPDEATCAVYAPVGNKVYVAGYGEKTQGNGNYWVMCLNDTNPHTRYWQRFWPDDANWDIRASDILLSPDGQYLYVFGSHYSDVVGPDIEFVVLKLLASTGAVVDTALINEPGSFNYVRARDAELMWDGGNPDSFSLWMTGDVDGRLAVVKLSPDFSERYVYIGRPDGRHIRGHQIACQTLPCGCSRVYVGGLTTTGASYYRFGVFEFFDPAGSANPDLVHLGYQPDVIPSDNNGNKVGVVYASRCTLYVGGIGGWEENDQGVYTLEFTRPVTDAACTAILAPGDTVDADPFSPMARVRNLGTGPATFNVRFTINSSPAYLSNREVTIPAGGSCDVTFDEWNPRLGTFSMQCTTRLAGDEHACDNYQTGTVTVIPAHDVSCLWIQSPAGTVPAGVSVVPEAWTDNDGTHTESYWVRMKIGNVYDESVEVVDQDAGEGRRLYFPLWVLPEPGEYVVTCSTRLATDQVPSNDKYDTTCRVLYPRDVSADSITSPRRVGYYQELTPMGYITNHYNEELTFWVKFVIGTVYADSHQVTMPGLTTWNDGFTPVSQLPPGWYDMKLIVRLVDDLRPDNDTFSGQLQVVDNDYWVKLNAMPVPYYLVLVEGRDQDQSVFALQRNGPAFAKYSVPLNLWNADIIPDASPLNAHYSADRHDDDIFALGNFGTQTAIAKYNIPGNRWLLLTIAPAGLAQYGGVFARSEETLYVLLRNTTQSFWRYVIPTNSWTPLANPPLGLADMAASTYDGGDKIHVLQVQEPLLRGLLHTYSISSGQWSLQGSDTLYAHQPGTGIAVSTVPGRNSVFALWPSSAATPGSDTTDFLEFDLSMGSTGRWIPCCAYFDAIGPYPSLTSRDGLPYASCGVPEAIVHTFGRYYPITTGGGGDGVCADAGARVTEFGLNSAPNPFTRGTTIRWQVPRATRALVAVYDAQGRLVKKLHEGKLEPGRYSRAWNTQGMPAGVYLCSFTSSERRMTERLVLAR